MNKDNSYIQTACLLTITAISVGVVLKQLSVVLIPLVLAIMGSYILAPIVDWSIKKLSLPKLLAILFSLCISLIILGFIGLMISSSIGVLSQNTAEYEKHINKLFTQSTEWLQNGPVLWLNNQGIEVEVDNFSQIFSQIPIKAFLSGLTNTLVEFLSNSFLILIFVIYLLEGRNPEESKTAIIEKIESKIQKYLAIKIILSLITGISVSFILWILGIDLAIVFGLLAFVLNFIPNVGSIIATLLPIPMVLVNPDFSIFTMVLALVLPGTIQMIIGNIIEPKLLGDSLELHPITVLLSLIFWGIIWGIAGMLLAAPITAVVKILLENIEITKPIASLMEGKIPKPKKEIQKTDDVHPEENITSQNSETKEDSVPPKSNEVTQSAVHESNES